MYEGFDEIIRVILYLDREKDHYVCFLGLPRYLCLSTNCIQYEQNEHFMCAIHFSPNVYGSKTNSSLHCANKYSLFYCTAIQCPFDCVQCTWPGAALAPCSIAALALQHQHYSSTSSLLYSFQHGCTTPHCRPAKCGDVLYNELCIVVRTVRCGAAQCQVDPCYIALYFPLC